MPRRASSRPIADAELTSTETRGAPARSVDELWLEVLEQIGARAAHELKGALNGVSVNVEVVRSRAAKAEASATSVAPFASSAADQLELVVSMTEALLALIRAPREPVDVVETVARLVAILAPAARAEGGSLRIEQQSREVGGTMIRAGGNAVRLVIGASLLAAIARKGDVRCRIEADDDTVVSIMYADDAGLLVVAPELIAAAAEAGIGVHVDQQSMTLSFARAGAARRRTPERA